VKIYMSLKMRSAWKNSVLKTAARAKRVRRDNIGTDLKINRV
jgi:hypothetical protein